MAGEAEALFGQHHQALFRYLCRAVGQSDVARDLLQDVFLRVSRTAVPVASAAEVRGWVFRIARNLVLDHHRRRLRELPAAQWADRSAPASQDVVLAVNEALAALSDLDRDVFLMREVGGLGYPEIAKACDLTTDAVRSRIHRARLQLRERLSAPIAAERTQTMRMLGRSPKGE